MKTHQSLYGTLQGRTGKAGFTKESSCNNRAIHNIYIYTLKYMHQALPPPPCPPYGMGPIYWPHMRSSPSPLWCGGGVALSPSPPHVVWGGGGVVLSPSPCDVVGVWYGMLGMYGVYGRSGMACLESMVSMVGMVCMA